VTGRRSYINPVSKREEIRGKGFHQGKITLSLSILNPIFLWGRRKVNKLKDAENHTQKTLPMTPEKGEGSTVPSQG